jgi:hypothetical protein
MALPTSVTIRGNQNTGDQSLTGGTQLTTMTVRLFADFQKYLEPDETPFSSSVKHGKAVNAKKVEFGIGFLAPHQVTLGATLASGTGTVSVTLAAGDGAKVQVTDVLRITSSTGVEHMWVTAIATDTLTVIRAMGGTTALQHTLATPAQVMEILGPAALENADTPIAPITKGAVEFNYPQLFDYAVQVSQREDNTPDYEFDGASRYDEYLSRIMTNANIDFEKSALMGKRGTEVAMTGATATPTLMGGLDFFTDRSYDLAGVALTEANLRTVQRDLWNAVGSNAADTIIAGGFMREALSSLYNANRYADVKDESTTLVWNSIKTEYGTLKFQMSRYIFAGALFFVNLPDIEIRPYKGGEWKDVQLPVNGPYRKGRFTGDYTMIFKKNSARAKVINASTTITDYSNLS